jgi:thiamine biosynthesis lipoprotein
MGRYLLVVVFLLISACGGNELNVISGSTMGTTYTVKTIGKSVDKQLIEERLKKINKIFSTWDEVSELSLLNKKPTNTWLDVSDELFYVLSVSKDIYQQTNGYFDPGIGRLIDLWGFGAKKIKTKPTKDMIKKSLQNSSIKFIKLKNGKINKTKDIFINLSAIAKGYAVDEVAKLLKNQGADNFLVEIGGEVSAFGDNNWTVGVERPNAKKPIVLELNNNSVATSGNYRNYFIWQGKKYMHILNPKTGLPANSDLASVSIVNKQTMLSDAFATAMMAMGLDKAKVLAKKLNLAVILILNEDLNFEVIEIGL